MPINFSNKKEVAYRAIKVWGWRYPEKYETFEEYRAAFAAYVRLSDPEEADALVRGELFTKFDKKTSVPTNFKKSRK
jgi:hypothetical protein